VRIEKRIAPNRDLRIGLGDLTELHADVALACIRAHRFREHANAALQLGRHLIEHRLHDRGHAERHLGSRSDPDLRSVDSRVALRVTRSLSVGPGGAFERGGGGQPDLDAAGSLAVAR
jgi:hypothetical protein